MKVKLTMKMGSDTHTLTEEESKRFGENEGLDKLLEAKGMITMMMSMIDTMDPNNAGKRIELIMEFDDGQYIVIGRKPKEDPNDGR